MGRPTRILKEIAMNEHPLSTAVDEFILALRADGRTLKTIHNYGWLLARSPVRVTDWLAQRQITTIEHVTTMHLRNYLIALQEHRSEKTGGVYSENTIDDYRRALHRFFKWASEEYGVHNPMKRIAYPNRREVQPKAVDLDNVIRLLATCQDDLIGRRDRVMILFMLDTGCRVAGVVGLRADSLSLVERWALVTEKGEKTRKVTFTSATAAVLLQWANMRPRVPYFFMRTETGAQLSKDGVRLMLYRRRDMAGLSGRVNPHSFRHAFAREYLRAGGDYATLSRLMGHSDVNTTLRNYAVFSGKEIIDAHEKYSPMNELARRMKKAGNDEVDG
jgi:site-specific recombinase XerD